MGKAGHHITYEEVCGGGGALGLPVLLHKGEDVRILGRRGHCAPKGDPTGCLCVC